MVEDLQSAAFLPTDTGVRRAVERLGRNGDPASIAELVERWKPWRAYATRYLWASLDAKLQTRRGK